MKTLELCYDGKQMAFFCQVFIEGMLSPRKLECFREEGRHFN